MLGVCISGRPGRDATHRVAPSVAATSIPIFSFVVRVDDSRTPFMMASPSPFSAPPAALCGLGTRGCCCCFCDSGCDDRIHPCDGCCRRCGSGVLVDLGWGSVP